MKQANLLQMNMQSMVVYDASQGYDEDTWDDSALIKAYDLAKESSRCSVNVILLNSLWQCVAENLSKLSRNLCIKVQFGCNQLR